MIILTVAELSLVNDLAEERQNKAIAAGAGDHTYISGNRSGSFAGHRDGLLGLLAASKLLGIDVNLPVTYQDRFNLNHLPSGSTFITYTTTYRRGALLKNKLAEDLKADYYLHFVKHSESEFEYIGFATHDELYSSIGEYMGMSDVYFRTQQELHKEIPE